MPIRRFRPLVIGAFLLAFAQSALSANVWLTDKQFQNRGAGEFVGTILSVQISSSSQTFESGTVQLQVNQVIAGTLVAPTINFAFQRALTLTDSLANWDLVKPLGASLETAVGDRLLVYFTESGGTYSIFPASNSVQIVTDGLLLGKILSVHRKHEDSGWNRDDTVEVEIQVSETIYGWVSGTTVTLPLSKHLLIGRDELRKGVLNGPTVSMLDSFGGGNGPASSVKADLLDENCCGASEGKQFVVAFVNGKISGVEIASKTFLGELQTLDSQ